MNWLHTAWRHLRHWSGDDAYERYLAEHREHGHELLSRREFYRQYFERQGKKARCC
ncbi:MAG: CstA-like transporter-associated (seleno)protein [Planctomycetota bacterium]